MDRMANRSQGAEEEIPSPMLKPNLMAAAAARRGAGTSSFQTRGNKYARTCYKA